MFRKKYKNVRQTLQKNISENRINPEYNICIFTGHQAQLRDVTLTADHPSTLLADKHTAFILAYSKKKDGYVSTFFLFFCEYLSVQKFFLLFIFYY